MRTTRWAACAVAAALVCVLAVSVAWSAGQRGKEAVQGRILVSLYGRDSRIARPTYVKVTTEKAWADLWQQHTGRKSEEYFDKSGMPRVNFRECMVVAAFHGEEWNNDGLSPLSLTEQQSRLVLRFASRWFQTAGPNGGGQKVRPYGIFVVPKSAKPVVVEEATHDRKDARDLTYTERARL